LLESNPGSKLFAVGDDWQSIYRFSGSDIFLFSQFKKHFGVSEILRIEKTYRYKEPLIKTSGNFIMANKSQMKKNIKGLDGGKTTIHSYATTEKLDARRKVVGAALGQLYSRGVDFQEKSVLFIGRYSFDKQILTEQVDNQNSPFRLGPNNEVYWSFRGVRYEGQFMTAHSAKGLEADFVFILNCGNGKHGFPSHVADDPALNLLLSDADQFEHGEERRLFYVAMTRAKEAVYFISNKDSQSIFIHELADAKGKKRRKCPKCVSAPLNRVEGISKEGNPYVRWDCINKSLGCDYVGWGD
jgi:DNA helicase-4